MSETVATAGISHAEVLHSEPLAMTADFETVQKMINSPPGQLAAGSALAGIVWKFFERVEAVLTDDTKLEIAGWLRGVRAGDQISRKFRTWPTVFVTVFDSVFTSRPLSWTCFWRSCLCNLRLHPSLSHHGRLFSFFLEIGCSLWCATLTGRCFLLVF